MIPCRPTGPPRNLVHRGRARKRKYFCIVLATSDCCSRDPPCCLPAIGTVSNARVKLGLQHCSRFNTHVLILATTILSCLVYRRLHGCADRWHACGHGCSNVSATDQTQDVRAAVRSWRAAQGARIASHLYVTAVHVGVEERIPRADSAGEALTTSFTRDPVHSASTRADDADNDAA